MNIRVEERTSSKGNNYSVLVIQFSNGYTFEQYLNNEQAFCIKQGLQQAEKK